MDTQWLSFEVQLKHHVEPEDLNKINVLLTLVQEQLNNTLATKQQELQNLFTNADLNLKGGYRNAYMKEIGPEHATWPQEIKGNRNTYHRFNIERTRTILLAMQEREIIADICEQHDWDEKNTDAIREELRALKIYPSRGHLSNILKSKKHQVVPTSAVAYLDYTMGDRWTTSQDVFKDEIYTYVRIMEEWISYTVPVPEYLQPHQYHFSKPIFYSKNGELMARYGYEALLEEPGGVESRCMGVDVGKVKIASGAVNYGDGSYSTELIMTRELERLTRLTALYTEELERIYKKQARRAALLRASYDPVLDAGLLDNWVAAMEQARELRCKRSMVKQYACWLAARDTVNHAVERGVSLVKLEELSWLMARGGLWDYACLQGCIVHVCRLRGIDVIHVEAGDSSHTNPFTDAHVEVNDNRELVLEDGPNIDRDYGADLELSRRPKLSRRGKKPRKMKKSRVLDRGACRDKHGPTPKRPKSPSNRLKRKIMREEGFQTSTSWAAFTVAVPLWSEAYAVRHSQKNTRSTIDQYNDLLQI